MSLFFEKTQDLEYGIERKGHCYGRMSCTYPGQGEGDDGESELDGEGVVLVLTAAVPGSVHHPHEDTRHERLRQHRLCHADADLFVRHGHTEVLVRALIRRHHL